MSDASLSLTAPSMLDLGDVISRLRTPEAKRVASAALAPAAMLVGAVGLLAVWTTAPRWPVGGDVATSPAAAAAQPQGRALEQAALSDDLKLSRLLVGLGAQPALTIAPVIRPASTATEVAVELRRAEAGMLTAADQDARARLQASRVAFRATGLDPRSYAPEATAGRTSAGLGDPRVLKVAMGIDPALARQVQHAARDLIAARDLAGAAAALPLATPVDDPVRSSPFGTRTDPFTGLSAFHPGQDFSGHYGQAIHVTAPGVVSFVGQRSGYGNCVEIDHGFGLKTRYGHLSGFVVGVGTPVKTGDVIGRMGSTGRSTGVHLHYEVWASGRLQDPARFLRAREPAQG